MSLCLCMYTMRLTAPALSPAPHGQVQGQADYVISAFRTRYETIELWGREAYVTAELAVLQARMADVLSNLSAAQAVRDQLYHTTQVSWWGHASGQGQGRGGWEGHGQAIN